MEIAPVQGLGGMFFISPASFPLFARCPLSFKGNNYPIAPRRRYRPNARSLFFTYRSGLYALKAWKSYISAIANMLQLEFLKILYIPVINA